MGEPHAWAEPWHLSDDFRQRLRTSLRSSSTAGVCERRVFGGLSLRLPTANSVSFSLIACYLIDARRNSRQCLSAIRPYCVNGFMRGRRSEKFELKIIITDDTARPHLPPTCNLIHLRVLEFKED
jgi:hypothetical protein